MKFNKILLVSSFLTLAILPACNWFGNSQNEPEIVLEEVLIVEPEIVETLQDQQLNDQELQEEINDLNLLNEK